MCGELGEGLFTEKQQEYVAGVDDADLRATLLHQVRLRDIAFDNYARLDSRNNDLTLQVIELKKLLNKQEK
jgi:hypothetical protein